jgi:hypothetical protein
MRATLFHRAGDIRTVPAVCSTAPSPSKTSPRAYRLMNDREALKVSVRP